MVAALTRKGWIPALIMGAEPKWGRNPQAFDPRATQDTLDKASLFFGERRWFRLDARGFETVPAAPALFVSNHSGGTTVLDAWGFFVAWYGHFGLGRPIHPTAHELVLSTETTGRFFEARGVLHAHPEVALKALRDHRRDVLVMPGGDRDAWRPFRDRYKVNFAGRMGYARLAIRAGVPIIPVAHAGAHHTLLVLSDGRRLAKLLGIKRLARAEIWPLHLALPWGLAFGPLPHLPTPTKLRYRIGKAIVPSSGPCAEEDVDETEVRRLDLQVRTSIQGMLDDLSRE